ncbi:DUF4270 domain-containing protein [Rhodocytophaga rosea]|uniref:DUF4270 domain-containing protein n=1 Tax=Rhodocytophaga rosea TaxID=2704465 RepID=A0A6C0GJB7_9BACT|nr:DUF4270 family protein [Rhodocytophaga rosea]QHT68136.1 DUF4270 domain-containing protein [Rhodocytophaga rosea]
MNFLIKRIAFFALLSFAFFSCEDPKDIGLDLQPENQNFGVLFTEDLDVQTTTILVDSVRTHRSPYFLAGRYQDPVLGTITAKSFLQVRYSSIDSTLNLGTSLTFDSLVLILDYEYDYGNTGQAQNLFVHRLTDSLRRKVYYNYDKLPYESTPVGSLNFVANTKRDTLRFRLSNELGNQLMSFAGKSEAEFFSSFYGLALMGGETDNGAVIAPIITASSTATVLRLYYHNSASADQKTYEFFLDGLNFNHIQSERTGVLAGLQNPYDALPSANAGELSYVQAGIGLMTKVEFPDIKKLIEKGNIGINRAELVIAPVDGTVVNAATPPPVLTLYGTGTDNKLVSDSAIRYIPLEGDFTRGIPNIANYNSTKKTYTFSINQYINNLLYQPSATNGLFLSLPSVGFLTIAANSNNTFSLPANTPYYERSVDRLVIGSRKHPTNPIKLRVYYTLVDSQ